MAESRTGRGPNLMLFMTIAFLQVSAYWWMKTSAGLTGKILITLRNIPFDPEITNTVLQFLWPITSFLINPCDPFIHISQGCYIDTWLGKMQVKSLWKLQAKQPNYQTTIKHCKMQIMCTILGIYSRYAIKNCAKLKTMVCRTPNIYVCNLILRDTSLLLWWLHLNQHSNCCWTYAAVMMMWAGVWILEMPKSM